MCAGMFMACYKDPKKSMTKRSNAIVMLYGGIRYEKLFAIPFSKLFKSYFLISSGKSSHFARSLNASSAYAGFGRLQGNNCDIGLARCYLSLYCVSTFVLGPTSAEFFMLTLFCVKWSFLVFKKFEPSWQNVIVNKHPGWHPITIIFRRHAFGNENFGLTLLVGVGNSCHDKFKGEANAVSCGMPFIDVQLWCWICRC